MSCFTVKEIQAKKPAEGIEIRVIPGERMTMAFFHMEPKAEIPEHSHPHEQMGTVLKGSIEIIIDKEKRIVNEGDAYHIPSNIVHGGRGGELSSEILEVYSPPREDLE
ncbi:MAG: cupin domain-containing protein [Thermodesulfobacteriota bacterium]|nr:cupin domain-containing protein [Thermodesulfobacteriota bacterium]